MADVTIFVFPEDVYSPLTPQETDMYQKLENEMKLNVFLLETETWRDISERRSINPMTIRENIDKKLKDIMDTVEHEILAGNPPATFPKELKSLGFLELYNKLVPERLKKALREAVAASGGARPTLNIFMHENVDWIPWELMNDKTDFLGLKFLVVRRPLISTAPSFHDGQPRQVRSILNLLGNHLYDTQAGGNGFDTWKDIFSTEVLPGLKEEHLRSFPNPEMNWTNFPNIQDFWETHHDIVHLICHGITTEQGRYYWTLDDDNVERHSYEINAENVQGVFYEMEKHHPLVFGNACSSLNATVQGHVKGLGPTCLNNGAIAFIGTLAPITRSMAPQFAKVFFHQLLEQGMTIGQAFMSAKDAFSGSTDPSWLFYCLYGSPETRFTLGEE